MLSLKQIQDFCLAFANDSTKCRYLDDDGKNYYCLKKSSKKIDLDEEVEEFFKECATKGVDPYQQNIPLGDNCSGYIYLKSKEQGYDQT